MILHSDFIALIEALVWVGVFGGGGVGKRED